MAFKKIIKSSILCGTLLSTIGLTQAKVNKEDINSNLNQVISKLPNDMKDVLVKNIYNEVFKQMLKELSEVQLTPAEQAQIQAFISKNKAMLIKDTFIYNATGSGGPAQKIWAEMERIKPELKSMTQSSKDEVENKVFPVIQQRMVKSIFKSKGYVANLGFASNEGQRSVDIGIAGNYCFKDYLIKSRRVTDACVELKFGSITGVKIKGGKIDLTDDYKRYLGKFKLAASLDGLSANYDANSSTFDFQLASPALILSRGPFSLKVAAVTGFSHDGAYLGADVSAAVQKSVGNMDYLARFGAQTATDGHQVYGQFEIKGKVSKDKRFGIYGRVASGNRRGPGVGDISGNTLTGGVVFGF